MQWAHIMLGMPCMILQESWGPLGWDLSQETLDPTIGALSLCHAVTEVAISLDKQIPTAIPSPCVEGNQAVPQSNQ